MKGIILAGGAGTRLHPLTLGVSKQLLPVYDKPMVYYPLSTLMLSGIREVLVISTPNDISSYQRALGDGARFGITIQYAIQQRPSGLPEAFIIGEEFIGGGSCTLILGDNLLIGPQVGRQLAKLANRPGSTIFGAWMMDPTPYGVIEVDAGGQVLNIEEKPVKPASHWAIPGLYVYDHTVVDYAKALVPSARGETEIVDLHNRYLAEGRLHVEFLPRATNWFDMGSIESLAEAGSYVRTLQDRQGLLLGSPEEIAWRSGWLSSSQLLEGLATQGESTYTASLRQLAEFGDARRSFE